MMSFIVKSLIIENIFKVKKISIQTFMRKGIPNIKILGIPLNKSIELATKIQTIFLSNELKIPFDNIQINLTPSGLKTYPNYLDLPITISLFYTIYKEQFEKHFPFGLEKINHLLFLGELNLFGELEYIEELPKFIYHAQKEGFTTIILPEKNKDSSIFLKNINYVFIHSLRDLITKELKFEKGKFYISKTKKENKIIQIPESFIEKLIIVIGGYHPLFLTGDDSSMKNMIYHFLYELLPERMEEEVLKNLIHNEFKRPFIKLDSFLTKNEIIENYHISLKEITAKFEYGLLILEDVHHYHKSVLLIIQSLINKFLPFWLVIFDKPCPCGNYYDKFIKCNCNSRQIQNHLKNYNEFLKKIIDISLILYKEEGLIRLNNSEIDNYRYQIQNAIEKQKERFKNENFKYNSQIPDEKINFYCECEDKETEILLEEKVEKKEKKFILKIARTIADLKSHPRIKKEDILFALSLRQHKDIFEIPAIQPFFSDPSK